MAGMTKTSSPTYDLQTQREKGISNCCWEISCKPTPFLLQDKEAVSSSLAAAEFAA